MSKYLDNEADIAFQAAAVQKFLLAGFTTVRDLGGTGVISLRNAINKGIVKALEFYCWKSNINNRRTCRPYQWKQPKTSR
jgi:hypothetical protein